MLKVRLRSCAHAIRFRLSVLAQSDFKRFIIEVIPCHMVIGPEQQQVELK